MRALGLAAMLWSGPASGEPVRAGAPVSAGDRDLCERGARHHGTVIDLDLKDADLHDVFRMLAEIGRVQIVVSDQVSGKVTIRLKGVPWDAAACAIAGVHHLAIAVQGDVLIITSAGAAGPHR
jgi:type IV pilus assembly protein PilQ